MKALVMGLGLTVTAGAGWYLLSRDDPSNERASVESTASAASADAPTARRARDSARTRDRARAGSEPRRDGTLEQRVARLEDEVAVLRRQLALRGRVSISGGSADIESIVDDPVLDQQVRSIVEEERDAERERRNERRAERIEEGRAEALDELVMLGKLDRKQREGIDGLWASEAERIIPIIAEARAGERSFREVRQELDEIRQETDEAAKEMLSEAQLEHYDEVRPRGPGGRRDRGRGGRAPSAPGQ